MRLRNKGVPSLRNKQVRGDHYVTLVVQVPTKMNSRQKELLKEFDSAMYGDVEAGTEESAGQEEASESKAKKKFGSKRKK